MTDTTEFRHNLTGMGTPEEAAYEQRGVEGALWTGGRLFMAIMAFAFAGLAFAYFYLRSANNNGLWRPHGVTGSVAIGSAVMAFTVAAAVVNFYGIQRLRRGGVLDWEVAGWTTVLGGLLALGFQCWEFTRLSFFPGSSGYASVFTGWSVMNCLLLFAGIYWSETLLVRHYRLRKALAEEGARDKYEVLTPRVTRINMVSSAHFWVFAAFVGVFFWIFMYVSV